MGKSKNVNNLSQAEIFKFYEYIYKYEQSIKMEYGKFNFEDKSFTQFCTENNITSKGRNSKKAKSSNFFWFRTHKDDKTKINDVAHHLLRHIRNAFAHGLIKKKNKNKNFCFEDYSSNGNPTMGGCMRSDLFWSFLDHLIETKKSK